jgi:uncharacterized protein YcgI (DUF1989 family)
MNKVDEVVVPAREARTFEVPAGHFFRIVSVEGPQVGDMNLWNADNLKERFYSSKTRQLHATHVSVGDRLWSCFPWMRPMATITHDTLAWYGWDDDGAGVHDVIGSRCDPYTNHVLNGQEYHHCCHSNLTRSLVEKGVPNAEEHVHDVLNVFMCTGFTKDTKQYFMKASPVRPGDFLEFFAEINLMGSISACPGGDCSSSHSDDCAKSYPLHIEIYEPLSASVLAGWRSPSPSGYSGNHGLRKEAPPVCDHGVRKEAPPVCDHGLTKEAPPVCDHGLTKEAPPMIWPEDTVRQQEIRA